LVAAKSIIAAVKEAETRIEKNPHTYPLHTSLLSDINGLMVQQAREAIARAGDQLREALSCASSRTNPEQIETLAETLHSTLIDETQSHRAFLVVDQQVAGDVHVVAGSVPATGWRHRSAG